jgi:hypothetical protein
MRTRHPATRRRRSICRSLAAGAVLALVQVTSALAQAGAPPGSIGIRLLEAPTNLADDPRAHLYVIDHLNQGDTIRRRIEVSSGLEQAIQLQLYAAGAVVSAGRFRFLEGRTQNELSSWIAVDPGSLEVPPHGASTAVVTIRVPKDALDGERYAVVWAQTPPSSPTDSGVAAIDRVGIRVYLSVGRGDAPAVDFRIESLTAERDPSGRPVVLASVRNTGGRAIDLSGALRLADGPGGLAAGPFPVQLGTTVGIGQRAPVRIVLSRSIPDGPWTAVLRLRTGPVERRAHARVTFPSSPGEGSTPVPATTPGGSSVFPVVVLPVIAALVLGLLLLLWLLWMRRRRREEPEGDRTERPVGMSAHRTRV